MTASGNLKRMLPGGSWRGITLKVENRSDTALKGVEPILHEIGYLDGPDFLEEIMPFIKVQRRDVKTHVWVDVPFVDYGTIGYLPEVDVAARKAVTLDLRMSVDEKIHMPPAFPGSDYVKYGYIGGGSLRADTKRADDDGVCLYARAKELYFDVYKSGTDTGDGDGGGTKPPSSGEPTPQAGTTAPITPGPTPTGDLAHTGSSSALPVIAGVGGAAVVLGAGAVYVVRRRGSGSGTHA
ncbi:LAETG motif-containing sortase-dependent surface protein [Streptomyces sp. NBC_00280]|uniref:LAETG motif-containing sortase-dependent surface protein n=1 Tax=Streptomyces sp. NBC_00280 TaxID=2975699 RepID=UPI0032567AA4